MFHNFFYSLCRETNKYINWTVGRRTKYFLCGSNGLWCERVDPVWSGYSALHAVFVKNKRTPLYPGVELLNGVLIKERDNVSGWTRGDTYSKQESALIMSHQPATMLCASLLSPRRLFAPRVLLVTPPQGLFWFSAVSLLEFVFSGRAAPRRAEPSSLWMTLVTSRALLPLLLITIPIRTVARLLSSFRIVDVYRWVTWEL